ncbi:Os02g0773700 [Oryza sativa Japonica Group]|uniref:Os02g0773700 protein n=1 Tax=Oryza sativa subsp. japonica TaxID=39947 RepID=A0A0N7KG64_ORYSJ|nr:hypothetical protein EE612_013960 [Oryza sativa]BAS81145.1 Os02g0773700 [Oryza sativa Japonica Group]
MGSCRSEHLPHCCLILQLLFPAHRQQLYWSHWFPLAHPSRRTHHHRSILADSSLLLQEAPGRWSWRGTARRSSPRPARGRATRRRGGRRTTLPPARRAAAPEARARRRGTPRTRRRRARGRRGTASPVARGRPAPRLRRRGSQRDRPRRSASTRRPSSDTARTRARRPRRELPRVSIEAGEGVGGGGGGGGGEEALRGWRE